ncbi:hypothetical protein RRG08_054276 [Elysia crispata]|uniref:Uncharacterized protein n=1 Tax=Elysia crispata TaxID=231223 RepID=A0AAE0XTS3_9GAST|nr:hypothetical protein RRG08_054276 [Elysia crispata]
MSCVLISLSLLLIMFWKTTEFDFEPTKQFEGKTVQAQCSVKKLFHGWVTNRDFKRLVSLHFDLSGGAAELGIYYIKENIRAVPLNNRNVHVRFVAGSSRNVTGYNMIVSLHDIRCTDGYKPSYCRLIIEDKQGQTLNLVNKGTLKVLAIPRDVDIETNNKNLDYFDAVPYSTVVLTCKGVAPPNLKVRWVRYFPLYNLAKQTVVEDFRAQKQPSIGKDSLCQKSKVYNYVSTHSVNMTALEHFSVYYCVFYDQKEGSLAKSKPVALFMKQNQDDAAKWCKKDYRLGWCDESD